MPIAYNHAHACLPKALATAQRAGVSRFCSGHAGFILHLWRT